MTRLQVRKQFAMKYGKEFVEKVVADKASEGSADEGNFVNPKVRYRLAYRAPEIHSVVSYLNDIAKSNGIEWTQAQTDLLTGDPLVHLLFRLN